MWQAQQSPYHLCISAWVCVVVVLTVSSCCEKQCPILHKMLHKPAPNLADLNNTWSKATRRWTQNGLMSDSKQILFLIQGYATGTFNAIPQALDWHSNVLNNMSGPTFTNGLHMCLVSFKHRKYQTMSLLNWQGLEHWGYSLHRLRYSPFSLLFQEVSKVITLVHVICMFMFLIF